MFDRILLFIFTEHILLNFLRAKKKKEVDIFETIETIHQNITAGVYRRAVPLVWRYTPSKNINNI